MSFRDFDHLLCNTFAELLVENPQGIRRSHLSPSRLFYASGGGRTSIFSKGTTMTAIINLGLIELAERNEVLAASNFNDTNLNTGDYIVYDVTPEGTTEPVYLRLTYEGPSDGGIVQFSEYHTDETGTWYAPIYAEGYSDATYLPFRVDFIDQGGEPVAVSGDIGIADIDGDLDYNPGGTEEVRVVADDFSSVATGEDVSVNQALQYTVLKGDGTNAWPTDINASAKLGFQETNGFNIEFSPDGNTSFFFLGAAPNAIICFSAGTRIDTGDGLHPVENLQPGDLVRTLDNGYQPVRWIGRRRLSAETLRAKPYLRPIRIRAGALGDGTPARDLIVSPQHRVLLRSAIARRMFDADEVLAAAKQLLELDGVEVAEDMTEVTYVHFLCERHEIVFADGALTESLYPGPQALKSLGSAALRELYELFPNLREHGAMEPVRRLLKGREARKLMVRHVKNRKGVFKRLSQEQCSSGSVFPSPSATSIRHCDGSGDFLNKMGYIELHEKAAP